MRRERPPGTGSNASLLLNLRWRAARWRAGEAHWGDVEGGDVEAEECGCHCEFLVVDSVVNCAVRESVAC